jgi:hypothetical protein
MKPPCYVAEKADSPRSGLVQLITPADGGITVQSICCLVARRR